MRLVAFGVGYVGLVTGTGLAELGHDVLCVDIDPERVRQLEDGIIPIYEPGLGDLVRRNERAGRLRFSTKVTPPYEEADAYFIAVGTPPGPDGGADIRAVLAAAETVAEVATRPGLVVIKSTVPVGTCDAVQARVDKLGRVPLEVVSNPEFLKEGSAVQDFFRPDRIILGARSEAARETLRALYSPLQLSGERLVVTDPRSSELTKYAANTMLAMRVSFMNELARLCHATGADIHAVRLGVGSDTRIGKRFLYAGPGYGGSCFPKDVQALMHLGRAHGVPMRLAEATHLANDEQALFLAGLVERSVGVLEGKTVALWGLAFKPETDDVRDAPSLKLTTALLDKGANVVGHDPEAGRNFARMMAPHGARVKVVERDYEALDGAHALVLLTEWRSYRAPSFPEMRKRLRGSDDGEAPVVIDARNVWRPGEVVRAGLRYQGIGVHAAMPASERASKTALR
jgi:UDPglucose 6-dehydrogenase